MAWNVYFIRLCTCVLIQNGAYWVYIIYTVLCLICTQSIKNNHFFYKKIFFVHFIILLYFMFPFFFKLSYISKIFVSPNVLYLLESRYLWLWCSLLLSTIELDFPGISWNRRYSEVIEVCEKYSEMPSKFFFYQWLWVTSVSRPYRQEQIRSFRVLHSAKLLFKIQFIPLSHQQ